MAPALKLRLQRLRRPSGGGPVMRALHIITGLGVGGAEQQLRLLLRHLPVDCDVVTLTNPARSPTGSAPTACGSCTWARAATATWRAPPSWSG
ncbi:hypothetical protein GCM10023238_00850 [Streptomyces heliomycini]